MLIHGHSCIVWHTQGKPDAIWARIEGRFSPVPSTVHLADELIAERREMAKKESQVGLHRKMIHRKVYPINVYWTPLHYFITSLAGSLHALIYLMRGFPVSTERKSYRNVSV